MVLSRFIRKGRSKCESNFLRVCLTSVRRRLNSSTRKKRTASWASGAGWCKERDNSYVEFKSFIRIQGGWNHCMKGACCLFGFQFSSTNLREFASRQPPKGNPTLLQQLLHDRDHINADAGIHGSAERRRVCVPRIPWCHDAGLFDVHCRVWRSPHRRWAEPVGKLKK